MHKVWKMIWDLAEIQKRLCRVLKTYLWHICWDCRQQIDKLAYLSLWPGPLTCGRRRRATRYIRFYWVIFIGFMQVGAYLMRLHWINIHQWTGRPMLLLEFGLIGLQHSYFTPTIKEQNNGPHPQHKNKTHNEHFFGADNNFGTWKYEIDMRFKIRFMQKK